MVSQRALRVVNCDGGSDGKYIDELEGLPEGRQAHMASRFSHSEVPAARAALNKLHCLQECVIRNISWREPHFALSIILAYVWTDDDQICFTVNQPARELVLTFDLVNRLTMLSALNASMWAEPERLNWGVSEIAAIELEKFDEAADGFAIARFLWEGARIIEVEYKDLAIDGPRAGAPDTRSVKWNGPQHTSNDDHGDRDSQAKGQKP